MNLESLYGLEIESLTLDDDGHKIEMELGESILQADRRRVYVRITDEGRLCCGDRYIRTDDRIGRLNNEKLVAIRLSPGPTSNDENADYACSEHDTAFLTIHTNRRVITFCTHNLHNGYYGGFDVRIDAFETRNTPEYLRVD